MYFQGRWISTSFVWIIAAISLVFWAAFMRRWRLIAGTPTSWIASASQGFVELHGRAKKINAEEVCVSPFLNIPCIWYHGILEKRIANKGQWVVINEQRSDSYFALEDKTGFCIVDPSGADIFASRKEKKNNGNERITEFVILNGDPVFCNGYFYTEYYNDVINKEAIADLLKKWKATDEWREKWRNTKDEDRMHLLELLEKKALEKVKKDNSTMQISEGTHFLKKQKNTPYLISSGDEKKVLFKLKAYTLSHFVVMLVAFGFGVYWA